VGQWLRYLGGIQQFHSSMLTSSPNRQPYPRASRATCALCLETVDGAWELTLIPVVTYPNCCAYATAHRLRSSVILRHTKPQRGPKWLLLTAGLAPLGAAQHTSQHEALHWFALHASWSVMQPSAWCCMYILSTRMPVRYRFACMGGRSECGTVQQNPEDMV